MKNNPILYLYEYIHISEDILYWKSDEHLKPWKPASVLEAGFSRCLENCDMPPIHMCVGIGTYQTILDGEIYLCALINSCTRVVESYSIGVYRSAELVDKALEIFFEKHPILLDREKRIIVRSSQNPVYKKRIMGNVMNKYPFVEWEMTEKGTRGGVMPVSTFFSQLMRRKGAYIFQTWQDAIDWLEQNIIQYNMVYCRNSIL